jgi:hypothetical protein
MIEQFGLTTNRNHAIDIATLKNNNNWEYQSDLQADAAKFEEGITYIDETLTTGEPVLIGVHYENEYKYTYNTNPATFHYIVIVGKIYKNNKEYYKFFDVGTAHETYGTNESNLLEIDVSRSLILGKYQSRNYIVTEIRKNIKK